MILVLRFFFGVAMSLSLSLLSACGAQNVFDCGVRKTSACSELTEEEKAYQLIDEATKESNPVQRREKFSQAIELLNQVKDEHEDLGFHALLASVYAARGGMLLWDMLKDQVFGGGSAVQIGLDSPFVPGPEDVVSGASYQSYVDDVGVAIASLNPFRAAVLASPNADAAHGSAALQLALYYPVHTFMSLKMLVEDDTGVFDPSKLSTMTDEQALVVINQAAQSAAFINQLSALSDEQKAQVENELAKINNSPGSAKAKIDQYLQGGGSLSGAW